MAIFDSVNRGDRPILERSLDPVDDPVEPIDAAVDSLPPRRDQIDEDGQVFDPGAPLCVEVELQALEAADGLVGQSSDLGHVPSDGQHLRAHALLNGSAEPLGHGGFELRRSLRERLERLARPLDGRVQRGPVGWASTSLAEALSSALQRLGVHGGDASVAAGR